MARRVRYSVAASLDGFIAGPDGEYDWIPAEQLTAAASQLVLLFGIGAFVGPVVGSFVMDVVGSGGYPWMAIATHGAITAFLLIRIAQYPAAVRAKPWNAVPIVGRAMYLPATVVAMGRRLRPARRPPKR